MIIGLDHANIRTGQLEKMIRWYEDVVGLTNGWRPGFPFPGAWLYAGDQAVVHLVAAPDGTARPGPDSQLEHVAFRAKGLADFTARLRARDEAFQLAKVPDTAIVQVNIWDPDGNHLHIDFDGEPAVD